MTWAFFVSLNWSKLGTQCEHFDVLETTEEKKSDGFKSEVFNLKKSEPKEKKEEASVINFFYHFIFVDEKLAEILIL